jgi:hypothetical protein
MFRDFYLIVLKLRADSTKVRTVAVRIFLCAVLFIAAGCVHRTKGIHNTVVIDQPFETAWPAIVKTARQMNPDASADMTTGIVSTGEFLTAENFHIEECARPPRRLFPFWTDTRVSATFTGRENKAGQTEVMVQCHFYRFNSNGDVWEVWRSLGRLEPILLAQMQGRDSQEAVQSLSTTKARSPDASLLLNERR